MQDLCKDLTCFLKDIGFEQLDTKNVEKAFVHPSYAVEQGLSETECYERLEFLGDAVLKLVVSDILYKKFPESREGKMTNLRSILVSDDFLFNLAEDLDLKSYIKISKALEKEGGRNITSISACAFEAFLGALYENNVGMEKIGGFLKKMYSKYIDNLDTFLPKFNSKAILQEYTQALTKERPVYELISKSGSDNDTTFSVIVLYDGRELGTGCGKSKKQAEREAAYQACLKLKITGEQND
ncbi:MAG: ribonuclease III [Candidatus Gastranaerophilales bacterium]|nr:ribonuclease III [Candidatus Gastranaerophilales bacterium]